MIGPVVQLDDTYLARLRRRDPEALRDVVDEQGRRLSTEDFESTIVQRLSPLDGGV